jgi:hemerythrin-like domain-containing protein
MAVEMAHVHNVILRAMNAIYHQCEHITKPADIEDFVTYIKMWGDTVHHHHSIEETDVFPQWDEIAKASGALASITSKNLEQHHAFEVGFEEFRTYALEMHEGKAVYDGKRVKAMLERFAPILNVHLHDEVAMILDMEKYDGPALKEVMDAAAQTSLKTADSV